MTSAIRPSIWWRSNMCTSSPSLNKAMLGEEGGKGNIYWRASSVASRSTPANTVVRWSGFFSFCKLYSTAGRALRAAQPQTEFTTNKVVPSLSMACFTASTVFNSLKPTLVSSSIIGFTNSGGYIIFLF